MKMRKLTLCLLSLTLGLWGCDDEQTSPSGTGGSASAGGAMSTGGAMTMGGSPSMGGTPSMGGSPSMGGAPSMGGSMPTGGAMATGGAMPTGGAMAMGGSMIMGGQIPPPDIGGEMAPPDNITMDDPCEMEDLAFFEQYVWRPIGAQICSACHLEGSVAQSEGSGFLLRNGMDAASMQANYDMFATYARRELGGTPWLLLKPSGQFPEQFNYGDDRSNVIISQGHRGRDPVPMGSERYAALEQFVARVRGDGRGALCEAGVERCADPWLGRRLLRRVTNRQYSNTLHSLFPDAQLPADLARNFDFLAEVTVDGFDNHVASLRADDVRVQKWFDAAEGIVTHLTPRFAQIFPCAPGEACAQAQIEQWGQRFYRRPLTDAEKAGLLTLYRGAGDLAAARTFEEGMQDVLTAFLMSPHFLYRSELGQEGADGRYTLDPFETATALSYLLWDTTPNDALLAAAANGELDEEDEIVAMAEQMMVHSRANLAFRNFVRQWLLLERPLNHDPDLFGDWTPEIEAAQLAEFNRYVGAVYGNDASGTLGQLFTGTRTYVSDTLRDFYGLEGGDEIMFDGASVRVLDTPHRPGVLGKGLFTALHSQAQREDPMRRGRVVGEQILCMELPLPLNMPLLAASVRDDPTLTIREKAAAHKVSPDCAGCHNRVDPPGFALQNFDAVGRYRSVELGRLDTGFVVENPDVDNCNGSGEPCQEPERCRGQARCEHEIEANGQLLGTRFRDFAFEDMPDFTEQLAQSPDAHSCFVRRVFQNGYGIDLEGHECIVEALEEAYERGDGTFRDSILALVKHPHFRHRESDEAEPGEPRMMPEPEPEPDPDAGMMMGPDMGVEPEQDAGMAPEPPMGESCPANPCFCEDAPCTLEWSTGDLAIRMTYDNVWDNGYRTLVDVTNESGEALDWSFSFVANGRVTSSGNAEIATADGLTVLSGKAWNNIIQPGETINFDFIGAR